jgi:hypothetical protein
LKPGRVIPQQNSKPYAVSQKERREIGLKGSVETDTVKCKKRHISFGLSGRRVNSIRLPDNSYHPGRTETLSTKIGLSIGAVMGFSSLRDELPNFARSENDRQRFKKLVH